MPNPTASGIEWQTRNGSTRERPSLDRVVRVRVELDQLERYA